MILLIGGESHTGKTLMAQRLLERYHFPYTSLDHIKMGLIRGLPCCGFTAEDNDLKIAFSMWEITLGIINTCLENRQNLILEGCYLPPSKVKDLICQNVEAIYLGFSEEYISKHYFDLIKYENIIEKRLVPEERAVKYFIEGNLRVKRQCLEQGLPYFEITDNYEQEINLTYNYLDEKIRLAGE